LELVSKINQELLIINNISFTFKLVLRERIELVDGAEHIYQLDHSPTEQLIPPKDLHFIEGELLPFGCLLELGLCQIVVLFVGLIQLQTCL
jgi:hypothetical protein